MRFCIINLHFCTVSASPGNVREFHFSEKKVRKCQGNVRENACGCENSMVYFQKLHVSGKMSVRGKSGKCRGKRSWNFGRHPVSLIKILLYILSVLQRRCTFKGRVFIISGGVGEYLFFWGWVGLIFIELRPIRCFFWNKVEKDVVINLV